tara:strand:+ start:8 stop:643 length:636 start_codon:yes stop_codon:yes gene_type:complete
MVRLLLRAPDAHIVTLAVAHRCLLRRSYAMAHAEYVRIRAASPDEQLPLLCLAACQLQLVMARRNSSKGERAHSALLGCAWMEEFAQALRDEGRHGEAAYSMARALHHLGLQHLAVDHYERVLEEHLKARKARAEKAAATAAGAGPSDAQQQQQQGAGGGEGGEGGEGGGEDEEMDDSHRDLVREAAHNMARMYEYSPVLARAITRTFNWV